MEFLRGQGAIESSSCSTARPLVGQGATEYLVLLAVVLIVALVSVALLGFFPGMASDAQLTQSQMYWRSASPISLVESGAFYYSGTNYAYLRIRNSGAYPIRLVGFVGANGVSATLFSGYGYCGEGAWTNYNLSDYFYLAPGEEKYIQGGSSMFGATPCRRDMRFGAGAGGGNYIGGASSVCQNSTESPGQVVLKNFGFDYIEYLDSNQQITKRQVGGALIIRCRI